MSEERDAIPESIREEVAKKYYAIMEWEKKERERIEAEMKKEGKWEEHGLDSNQHFYHDIIEARRKKVRQLRKEYGLIKEV